MSLIFKQFCKKHKVLHILCNPSRARYILHKVNPHILEILCGQLCNTATAVVTLTLKEKLCNKSANSWKNLNVPSEFKYTAVSLVTCQKYILVTSDYCNRVLHFLTSVTAALHLVQTVSIWVNWFQLG